MNDISCNQSYRIPLIIDFLKVIIQSTAVVSECCLHPDCYYKERWTTLLWVIILYDACTQMIQRHRVPAWTPCWLGYDWQSSANAQQLLGCENRFYDLPRSWVGTGPLTAPTHFRTYVNHIKHFEMHKIALGQLHGFHMILKVHG